MARKAATLLLWSLSVALAVMFLMSGSGKLLDGETAGGARFGEQFERWGYPAWFRIPVGVVEVAGAIVTHLRAGEAAYAPFPLALGALTALLAWMARPRWVQERMARRDAPAA